MRLLLTLRNGEQWMGMLHKRDEVKELYVISDPEDCSTGKKCIGRLVFKDDEIESVHDVVENVEINRKPQEDLENLSTRRRLNLVMDSNSQRAEKIVILNKLNDHFIIAVREISREIIIGFAVEGRLIGRNGKICSLQILADNIIYIFDMMHLSNEFFQSGLRDILEDEKIQKVIHDCRFISDALYHTYGIVICNVYDTQVADIMIRKNNFRAKFPTTVRDLGTCLRDYLALKPNELSLFSLPRHLLKEEQIALTVRPFTDEVLASAADAVRYLRRLRLETMQRLLQELEVGIDVYLSHVKDSTPRDIALMSVNEVPEKMKLLLTKQQQSSCVQPRVFMNTNLSTKKNYPRATSTLPSTNRRSSIDFPKPTSQFEWGECDDDRDVQMQVLKSLKRLSTLAKKDAKMGAEKRENLHSPSPAAARKDKKSPPFNGNYRKSSSPLPERKKKTNDVTSSSSSSRLNLLPAGVQPNHIPKDLKRWEKLKQKNLI